MPDSALTSSLLLLVGGLLGHIATVSTPYLQHRWQTASALKQKRIERFEELLKVLDETDHWLQDYRAFKLFRPPVVGQNFAPSPFWKVRVITSMHFCCFNTEVAKVRLAVLEYQNWIENAAYAKFEGKENYNNGFELAYSSYHSAHEGLVISLLRYASTTLADDTTTAIPKMNDRG